MSMDWDIFVTAAARVQEPEYEDRLKEFMQGPPISDWTAHEAFMGIILQAAHADGDMAPQERDQIKGLSTRSRILKGLTSDQIEKASFTVRQRLKDRPNALQEACQALPQQLRLPVFVLAVDIVLADGKILPPEQDFIKKISNFMGIPESVAHRLTEVMLIKNNC